MFCLLILVDESKSVAVLMYKVSVTCFILSAVLSLSVSVLVVSVSCCLCRPECRLHSLALKPRPAAVISCIRGDIIIDNF